VRRTSLIGLIEVAGVLRLGTVARLREAVGKVLPEGPEALVLDLSGVEDFEDELSLVMFSTLGRLVADRAQSELVLAVPSLRLRVALQRAAPFFVRVFPTRAEAWLAAEQGAARRRVSEQLPATPYAPRLARHLVEEMCTRWELGSTLRERAQVVVTELVTNAVRSGAGDIELIITVRRYVLRLEVSVHSTVLPHPREPSLDTVGGYGLQLVTRLASHWDTQPTPHGKIIWADLIIRSPAER
jgi:anti-sigma regulatory factor (Ser/Thr protein kinase)/anti-anti-sigma regulatory factor